MGRRIWFAAGVLVVVVLLGATASGEWVIRSLALSVASQAAIARGAIAQAALAPGESQTPARAAVLVHSLAQPGLIIRLENHEAGFALTLFGDGTLTSQQIPRRPRNAFPPPHRLAGSPPGGAPPGGAPPGAQPPPGGVAPPPPPHSLAASLALSLARVAPERIVAEPLALRIFPDGKSLANTLVTIAIVAFAIVLFILGLAWVLAASFERAAIVPLLQTSDALEALAAGDFSVRTIAARGSPHIERLARAYNAAARQVAISFEERRQAAEEFQRFLADAGHELRTPLTIVSGYVDIMCDNSTLDDLTRERVLRGMRSESARMRALVEKMLLLARMEAPVAQPRPVEIDASVADVVHALRSRHPQRTISMSQESASFALLDEDDLYEALFNLVENAVRYAPQSDIFVETHSDERSVRIAVVDHGPGIALEDQSKVFERFYRGRDGAGVEGSGLGLAIVKRAVERWGGSVHLESRAGETRFDLSFPRWPEAA